MNTGLGHFLPLLLYLGLLGMGLLALVYRPAFGIYALVAIAPLQTARYKLSQFFMGEKIIDILVLCVLLGVLFHPDRGTSFRSSRLNAALWIFGIFLYISLWFGSFVINAPVPISPADPRFSVWKNHMVLPLIFVAALNAIRTQKEFLLVIVAIMLSAGVVARGFISSTRGRDMSKFSYDIRDAGPLGYAGVNGLAAYESNLSLFLIGIWPAIKNRYVKLLTIVVLALNLYCLLFAFSRGAYAGFAIGLVVLAILRYRILLIPLVVVAVAWTTVLPPAVVERITGTYSSGVLESSAAERVELWEDAMKRIASRPILGSGYETYAISRSGEDLRDTHNYYLKVLVETGVVGLIIFLFLMSRMWTVAWHVFRNQTDPFARGAALGMVACLASFFVVNFFGDRWTYVQVNGMLWALLGAIARFDYREELATTTSAQEGAVTAAEEPLIPAQA
jgi:O-antigen ligase